MRCTVTLAAALCARGRIVRVGDSPMWSHGVLLYCLTPFPTLRALESINVHNKKTQHQSWRSPLLQVSSVSTIPC